MKVVVVLTAAALLGGGTGAHAATTPHGVAPVSRPFIGVVAASTSRSAPATDALTGGRCLTDPDPPAYYAFPIVTTRAVPGTGAATGTGTVIFPSTPFGVSVAADGSYLLDVALSFDGLKPPRTGAYVVWFTTPDLDRIERAGVLDGAMPFHGSVSWNKFLVVVTLEEDPEAAPARWSGPIVLRGMSRSGLMHTMAGHGPFEKENCASYGY